MRARALRGVALAVALAGCAGDGPAWPGLAAWWPGVRSPDPEAAGRQAARSIWGVVPRAPRRKADLRPDMIRGSAVAVSADTLLASCAVAGGRSRVGLVRHNKYRIARVRRDGEGRVCRLTVAEGPLTPVAGFRTFADLRVGEPVVALASRTAAEVAAAPGWLAGKGSADDPFLEATSTAPPGSRSVVLADGFGNLIGLGAAGPLADAALLAVPVGPAAAPALANRDLGPVAAAALVAALAPSPRTAPRRPPSLLLLRDSDRGGGGGPQVAAAAAPARGDPGAGQGAPATGSSTGSGGGGTGTGAPSSDAAGGTGGTGSGDPGRGPDRSPATGGAPGGGAFDSPASAPPDRAPGDGPGANEGDGPGFGGHAGRGRDRDRGRGLGAGRDGNRGAGGPGGGGDDDRGRGRGRGRGGDRDGDDD